MVLPRVSAGQPLTAEYVNRLVDAIEQNLGYGGGTDRVTQRLGGTSFTRPVKADEKYLPRLIRVKVIAVKDDYLECKLYNPGADTDGDEINVAKPWMFRKTPFDGETWEFTDGGEYEFDYTNYTDDNGLRREIQDTTTGDTIIQSVTPAWMVGEILVAERRNTGVDDDDNNRVAYEDITAGRVWAGDC